LDLMDWCPLAKSDDHVAPAKKGCEGRQDQEGERHEVDGS
jgi:hypothetical protein